MKLNEYKGKENSEYKDLEVRILIKDSAKNADSPATGKLRKVLDKLGLDDSATYWDLKCNVWELLDMPDPVRLSNERKTIFERSIDNSAEIKILLKREGTILINKLRLPEDPDKDDLDDAFLKRIIG